MRIVMLVMTLLSQQSNWVDSYVQTEKKWQRVDREVTPRSVFQAYAAVVKLDKKQAVNRAAVVPAYEVLPQPCNKDTEPLAFDYRVGQAFYCRLDHTWHPIGGSYFVVWSHEPMELVERNGTEVRRQGVD